MAKWLNRSVVQGPRNGTNSHTITFTPAAAGNLLVLVMEGSVTHTVPTGWTRRAQALNYTELSVYTKTAADGESSFSTTHNGSNYPIGVVVYEFPPGSSWVSAVAASNVGTGTANPALTGLTGSNLLMGAVAASAPGATVSTSWDAPNVEDFDINEPTIVGGTTLTDGYLLSAAYTEDSTATTYGPLGATANTNPREALTFAVNAVPVVTPPPAAPAAVTFAAGTPAESTTAVTTISVPLPSGYAAGDYTLLVGTSNASGGGFTTVPAGYTEIYALDTVNGSTSGHGAAYFKKWASGDTNPVLTFASGRAGAQAFRVRGADQTNFLDGPYAVTQAPTATTAVTAPSRTPSDNVAHTLVSIFTARSSSNGVHLTFTPPAGMTQIGDAGGQATTATNSAVSVSVLDGVTAASGTKTATASATTTGAFGVSLLINAAPVVVTPTDPNQLVSTSFTGTNGAAWPAPWTTGTGNTIQSNRGQQQTTATQWTDAPAQANQLVPDGRVDATARFPNATGTSMRVDVRFSTATGNGYRVIFGNDYSGFQLFRVTGWAETLLISDTTAAWVQNTDYRIAVDFSGSTVRAKRWVAGAAEPSAWNVTATDSAYTTGDVRLVTVTSTAASTIGLWDEVTITKASAPATPSVTDIPNQSRGWFHYTETHAPGATATTYVPLTSSDLQTARTAGRRLVFRYIILDQFLGTDTISQAFKDLLTADFTAVRAAGMKLVIRFTYSNSGKMTAPYGADPAPARVLTHIQQLAATLNASADVIDGLQQGFVGMWGEQYYTDNFGDVGNLTAQNWTDRKAVINALLDNLDERIFIHIRYVGIKRRLADEGMTAARLARLGHHNDAFLAPSDDYGTYHTFTSYTAAQNREWLASDTAATRLPVGGESAIGNPPTSDLANAKVELAKSRWTYLNPSYHQDVLTSWGEAGRAEVGARLGHNLTVGGVTATVTGTSVAIAFDVTNVGWAAPYRSHPVIVDFVSGATVVSRTLAADTKAWVPGTIRVSETITAPTTAGTWSLHLRIIDPSASLQANAAYSMQVAGPGTYDATTGRNPLGASVTSTAAPVTATTGQTPIAFGSTATATKVSSTTGQTPVSFGATAAATKVASTTGSTPVSFGSTASATKVSSTTGQTPVSFGATATSSKVSSTTGQTPVSFGAVDASIPATPKPVYSTTGSTPIGFGSTATATAVKSTAGSTPITIGATATAEIVAGVVSAGPDQTVQPWATVTLTATGTGTWSQVSGTAVALAGTGTTRTFTAPPSMAGETLVFAYGGDQVSINVAGSKLGIVKADGGVGPVRLSPLAGTAVEVRRNTAVDPQGTVLNRTFNQGRWFGGGTGAGTYTVTSGPTPVGNTFIRKAWTAAAGGTGDTGVNIQGNFPIVPGQTLHVIGHLRSSITKTMYVRLQWRIGATAGATVSAAGLTSRPGEWERIEGTFTAPAGVDGYALILETVSGPIWAPGDTLDATGLLMEIGTSGPYFDGRSPSNGFAYSWTGAADNSPSIEAGVR